MRKTIARRLTEVKQTDPAHLSHGRHPPRSRCSSCAASSTRRSKRDGVKLSVNDLLIKALAKALLRVPQCNVSFAGDELLQVSAAPTFRSRSSTPAGLITPIVVDAGTKSVSQISTEMKDAGRHGARRQAAAARIPGRHRQHLQPGHVRDQAVRRGDQSAAGDDHGGRRGREAAVSWSTARSRSPP